MCQPGRLQSYLGQRVQQRPGPRFCGIEPARLGGQLPSLGNLPERGVHRGQVEVRAGAPAVEVARTLQMGTSGSWRIAGEKERQPQLLVRFGPVWCPATASLIQRIASSGGAALECERPEVERRVRSRGPARRVGYPGQSP